MPISQDVMELVGLLNEEGFGALAGEIMTQVSLGRETFPDSGEASAGDWIDEGDADLGFGGDPDGEPDAGEAAAVDDDEPAALARDDPTGSAFVLLDDGLRHPRRYHDRDGGKGDPVTERVELEPDEQLAFAVRMVQLRLVEPARRLAEAERLAATLASAPPTPAERMRGRPAQPTTFEDRAGAAIRIEFRSGAGGPDRLRRDVRPGTTEEAEELDAALRRLLAGV